MEDQEITLPPSVCKVLKVAPGKQMYTSELVDRIINLSSRASDQEYTLSKPLSQFVGLKGPCTKDVPMKRIIKYIKTNHLDRGQDWSIIPDDRFAQLLGPIDQEDLPLTFANLKKYILRHMTPVSSDDDGGAPQVLTSEMEMQTDPVPAPEGKNMTRKQLYKWLCYDMVRNLLNVII